MKTRPLTFAIAALSAAPDLGTTEAVSVAVLSQELTRDSDGWQQLLPAGKFKAVDGRPSDTPDGHWYIDAEIAAALIAGAQSCTNPLVIDYEHQTLKAKDNGQPAPAAGWFKAMEWRDSGLWIKPQWNERASQFIQGGEYQYLSAVFIYDTDTGHPVQLHSAALTNRPGIDGMKNVEALAALSLGMTTQPSKPTSQEHSMNELLKAMLAALGIEWKEGDAVPEEQQTAALNALATLKSQAESSTALATKVAALEAADTAPDPARFVPMEAFAALQTRVAALSAQTTASQLDQVIDKAKQDGRLLPAMESWARDLGGKDMAALTAFLETTVPIAALSAMQTETTPPPQGKKTAALSAEELEVAKLLGKTPEEFAAGKAQA